MSTCDKGETCETWKMPPGLIDPLVCQHDHPPLGPHESAIVFTHNLYHGKINPRPFQDAAKWQKAGVDLVLITPPEHVRDDSPWTQAAKRQHWRLGQVRALHDEERTMLKELGVIHHVAPWALPPGLTPQAEGCASMDFLRLHVLNMTQYKAVVYFDGDVSIVGDVQALLRCAATGKLLMASGIMAPLNYGVKAVKPTTAMFEGVSWFAGNAEFVKNKPKNDDPSNPTPLGWDGAGPVPHGGGFPGYGCGQGLGWTFFYGNGPHAGKANHKYASDSKVAVEAHKRFPYNITHHMLDRCVWNYQFEDPVRACAADFTCRKVQIAHKGHKRLHLNHLKMKRGVCGNCTTGKGCVELTGDKEVAQIEDGWRICATEGMTCSCNTYVKFGWYRPELGSIPEAQSFPPRKVQKSIPCKAQAFGGDPAPRAQKACFCSTGAAAPATTAGPALTAAANATNPGSPSAPSEDEAVLRAQLLIAAADVNLTRASELISALAKLRGHHRGGAPSTVPSPPGPRTSSSQSISPQPKVIKVKAGGGWYDQPDAEKIAEKWGGRPPPPAAWHGKGPCGVMFPRPAGCGH